MKLHYRQMQANDIENVTPLFIQYWNHTGDCWTAELVRRRIWQTLGAPDSYCLIAECNEAAVGFALGRFETFSDMTVYNLAEIIVAEEYQNLGVGTSVMAELERRVKDMGAAMIQLICINDEMHAHFYGKLGYATSDPIRLKFKTL